MSQAPRAHMAPSPDEYERSENDDPRDAAQILRSMQRHDGVETRVRKTRGKRKRDPPAIRARPGSQVEKPSPEQSTHAAQAAHAAQVHASRVHANNLAMEINPNQTVQFAVAIIPIQGLGCLIQGSSDVQLFIPNTMLPIYPTPGAQWPVFPAPQPPMGIPYNFGPQHSPTWHVHGMPDFPVDEMHYYPAAQIQPEFLGQPRPAGRTPLPSSRPMDGFPDVPRRGQQ
ncbi:hypothetical protein FDECE_5377 [Fusarium decemcellulare]|nr:hypothetical protein FDECE_5377 [Fusarium decemcellulare]